MTPAELRIAVLPYIDFPAEWLTLTRLGRDARKAPFIRKRKTMKSVEYAIAFVSQNESPSH